MHHQKQFFVHPSGTNHKLTTTNVTKHQTQDLDYTEGTVHSHVHNNSS